MKSKYLKITKSVLISWITSYALILLIPLVINSYISIRSIKIIEKQITDSNVAMLNQFQSDFDGHVSEIENIGYKINSNSKLANVMKRESLEQILGSYTYVSQVLEMNQDFNVYSLTDRFISSVFIYFNDKDLVWADSNLYTKREFYDAKISNKNIDFKAWQNMMNKKYANQNSQVYLKGNDTSGIKTMAHFQSLPIESLNNAKANLVIVFDQNKLIKYTENISKVNNSLVYIVNKDNYVLFNSINNSNLEPVEKYNDMIGDIGNINTSYKGENVVVSYISSKTSGWKYVCVIPSSVFQEKVVYIRNLTVICFLFSIILGGIAIFWFARKNYDPVNELVNTFKNMPNNNKNLEYNEFGFIKNSIVEVFNQREFVNMKLEVQNHALYLNFISRLLKGRFVNKSPDFQALDSFGITFDSEIFIVIIFYIDVSANLEMDKLEYIEDNYMTSFEALILQEFKNSLGEGYNIYSSKPDEMLTCILNLRTEKAEKTDEWKKEIDFSISQLRDNVKSKINIDLTVSISELNKTIYNIPRAYQEALEAMEYRLFDLSSNVFYYDEIKLRGQKNYGYYYNIEDEQKLINSIKIGDFIKSEEMVQEVLKNNFSEKMMSINMAKFVIIDLISTFIKALSSDGILNESSFGEDSNFIEKVVTRKTIDEMKVELINCLRSICDHMLIYSQSKSKNKIVDKIKIVVENNFCSETLNVSTLANDIGMNAKYISSIYKEFTGESIMDLINTKRINKAKILLKESMSIAVVAQKVGFNDSNSLIRVFKKYEGITPGQFKEL